MEKSAADAVLWGLGAGGVPPVASDMRVLFAGARPVDGLHGMARCGRWTLLQAFRPWADALAGAGDVVTDWPEEGDYDLALALGTKQTEESCALLAGAASRLKDGGWLVAGAANDEGGKRLAGYARDLGLAGESLSKHHARVIIARKNENFRADIARDWMEKGAMRIVPATGLMSCPGLFSWDRIDDGSALLARHLPDDLKGAGADFGCGTGYLSKTVFDRCAKVTKLYCLDADARAVAACRVNVGADARAEYVWADLTKKVDQANGLDWVVMNPPFHAGKANDSDIGRAFIATAAAALKRRGVLYMVANGRLPYEQELDARFARVEKLHEGQGYKIYRAVKE